jgi:hypothetical protein
MSLADWPQHRVYHRQMYVDLVRAYLLDYGSQSALARALNLTEAYVSFLLEPPRLVGQSRLDAHWGTVVSRPAHEISDALKFLKSPSLARARELSDHLVSDQERREVLLHHIQQAGRVKAPEHTQAATLDHEEVELAAGSIGELHQVALHGTVAAETQLSYAQVWEAAQRLVGRIGGGQPVHHAQVLLFLHDAASVLDRHDLALGYARQAAFVVVTSAPRREDTDLLARFHINAVAAEAVSLNNLGLHGQVLSLATKARRFRGFDIEPEHWQRTLIEERLKAMAGRGRFSIYEAEAVADQARALIPEGEGLQFGIISRLVDVYLAHRSERSMRRADALLDVMHRAAGSREALPPLRQIRILRSLAQYFRLVGDKQSEAEVLGQWQRIAEAANLAHQRAVLERRFD